MNLTEPDRDCALCPRLRAFILDWRGREAGWHNAPVPTFSAADADVRLLVVGLAPGLRGANRTGRPFTGDFAGDLLYRTLIRFGLAEGEYAARPDDGIRLKGAAITNAVRCVPPENKPVGQEINTCRQFLQPTLERFQNLKVVVTLGKIAHESTVRALGERLADHPFRHGGQTKAGRLTLHPSYHCSRYNTNTGRLTEAMFADVFSAATRRLA
ncbi:MAG: uracil-DNA glycosylase [Rhizobiaceae bacterium]